MKYPKECPAFEYKGRVYEGRPGYDSRDEFVMGLTLVNADGFSADMRLTLLGIDRFRLADDAKLDEIKPLTAAASQLMEWVRG